MSMRLDVTKAEGKTKATRAEAVTAMHDLRHFINRNQLAVIAQNCYGEERQFFYDKLAQLAALVATMPKTYETDGKGDAAIIHLHYFTSGCDWWIIEKDCEPEEQAQAFGMADIGQGFEDYEKGYISLIEILGAGAELDLYWHPVSVGQFKSDRERRQQEAREAREKRRQEIETYGIKCREAEAAKPERPFVCRFMGRTVGAIGLFTKFRLEISAQTPEAAKLKIYETHEHITGLVIAAK